jgi:two-component system, cell cycle sensor histidine kinase and response regulator CckA
MRSLSEAFGRLSRWQAAGVCLGLILMIGAVDYETTPEGHLALLYLLPISLGAWLVGRSFALTLALLSAATAFVVDLPYRHVIDSAGQLGIFAVVAVLVGWVKVHQDSERADRRLIEGIINTIPARVFWKDKDLIYLGCNALFARDAGLEDPRDIVGKSDYQLAWREQAELYRADDREVIECGRAKLLIEEPQTTPGGDSITLLTSKVPLRGPDGEVNGVLGTYSDISARKRAEDERRASDERFERVFESKLIAIGIAEMTSGRLIDVNGRCAEFFGYERDEMIGRTVFDLGLWADPADRERLVAAARTASSGAHLESAFRCKSGEIRHALVSMEAMTSPATVERLDLIAFVDLTERKRLEMQLLQSQKMEAIGRLAGGVAHDFNNHLGVIIGYAELLLREADEAQRGKLDEILKAAQRASGLTRQLLAFSRKQVVAPTVLDLNVLLSDLKKMLGRLIGEDVDLALVPGANLGQVKADPGQLEQVVMNLSVNARDAMSDGGLLRIETANVDLQAADAGRHQPMTPGRYVMLAVSDSGCGMEKEILSKIFEPFFTTKEQGKGTGLGLATVYGIVKQAGGFVWVYSEVGHGTTFKVYLPRVDEPASPSVAEDAPMPPRGSETILLAEDDAALRALAREILEENGYRVLEAAGADLAVEISNGHLDPIHLLLTDVVMPGMNGRQLAESLVASRPEIKVLYMSGYTDDVIARRGVLEAGTLLVAKPFTAQALLRRVRDALGDRNI